VLHFENSLDLFVGQGADSHQRLSQTNACLGRLNQQNGLPELLACDQFVSEGDCSKERICSVRRFAMSALHPFPAIQDGTRAPPSLSKKNTKPAARKNPVHHPARTMNRTLPHCVEKRQNAKSSVPVVFENSSSSLLGEEPTPFMGEFRAFPLFVIPELADP
jgi:hypothetical protein